MGNETSIILRSWQPILQTRYLPNTCSAFFFVPTAVHVLVKSPLSSAHERRVFILTYLIAKTKRYHEVTYLISTVFTVMIVVRPPTHNGSDFHVTNVSDSTMILSTSSPPPSSQINTFHLESLFPLRKHGAMTHKAWGTVLPCVW